MKKIIQLIMLAMAGLGTACLVGCASTSDIGVVGKSRFGKTPDGTRVEIYTLRNSRGMEASIMTYGGTVVSLKVPDKHGKPGDIVLGYDKLGSYLTNSHCFGALIGRYANGIANGQFALDGTTCMLGTNNGLEGFDKVVWKAKPVETYYGPALELTYVSKDGEEGYPGNLSVTAIYSVTEKNELLVQFKATTDKDTVCNFTHHSCFNLRGGGDILDHVVQIDADKFTPVDSALIPTGELKPVDGTPFDFRKATAIGAHINDTNDDQIKFAGGYDHNWVLNKLPDEFGLAATVYEPTSGRVMEVWTTEPGLQFSTGHFLDKIIKGKKGKRIYQFRDGFCMEPQHFPDSPNHPDFPTTELKPGEIYQSTIFYKFSTK